MKDCRSSNIVPNGRTSLTTMISIFLRLYIQLLHKCSPTLPTSLIECSFPLVPAQFFLTARHSFFTANLHIMEQLVCALRLFPSFPLTFTHLTRRVSSDITLPATVFEEDLHNDLEWGGIYLPLSSHLIKRNLTWREFILLSLPLDIRARENKLWHFDTNERLY